MCWFLRQVEQKRLSAGAESSGDVERRTGCANWTPVGVWIAGGSVIWPFWVGVSIVGSDGALVVVWDVYLVEIVDSLARLALPLSHFTILLLGRSVAAVEACQVPSEQCRHAAAAGVVGSPAEDSSPSGVVCSVSARTAFGKSIES